MYNNNEYDSEDDDGYFLTPVLHYDISNKIIEANKILFEEQDLKDDENSKIIAKNQKYVTFAKELVSFAEAAEAKDEIENDNDGDDDDEGTKKIVNNKLNEIANDVDSKMTLSAVQEQQQQDLHNLQDNKNKSLLARDPPFHASNSTATTSSSLSLLSSPIKFKQREEKSSGVNKVCEEEERDEVEEEVEEKLEIFNAEITENSAKVEKITKNPSTTTTTTKTNNDNNVHNNDVNNDNYDDDDYEADGDDYLSIQVGIVARESIRREALEKDLSSSNKKLPSSTTTTAVKASNKNRKNVANIKFNYKICCEYAAAQKQKEHNQQRLPEYRGLISEYGLSGKERNRLMQHKKRQERSLLEMEMRTREEILKKLTANEQAFCTWLRNKCRQLPNRTRNMFDFNTNKRKNNGK